MVVAVVVVDAVMAGRADVDTNKSCDGVCVGTIDGDSVGATELDM